MAKTASSLTVTTSSRLAAARRSAPQLSGASCHASEARPHPPRLSSTQVQDHRVSELLQRQVPVRSQVQMPSDRGLCSDLSPEVQNVAGATSSTATSCRRRPSTPLQRAFQALSSCSALSCSALSCSTLSSSDQRRPRRSFSTRTSTHRCRPSSRPSAEPRRCRRAVRRARCRR